MSNNFRIGQRVVCVDDSPGFSSGERHLKAGQVYVISGMELVGNPGPGLYLVGVPLTTQYRCGTYRGWNPTRFRPLTERKTDISIFTEMLKPKPKQRVTTER